MEDYRPTGRKAGEALGQFAMSIMKRVSKIFGTRANNNNGIKNGNGYDPKVTRARAEQFVAQRKERVEQLTDADVDEMTQAALAGVDRSKTLREARTLREKRKIRTGQSVRRHPE